MPESLTPNASPNASVRRASTTAYASSLVAKTGPGVLYGVRGHNSAITAQFILVHDTAALPANAAVPIDVITVPASSSFSIEYGTYGIPMNVGITISNSTTGPTQTLGAADTWIMARFR